MAPTLDLQLSQPVATLRPAEVAEMVSRRVEDLRVGEVIVLGRTTVEGVVAIRRPRSEPADTELVEATVVAVDAVGADERGRTIFRLGVLVDGSPFENRHEGWRTVDVLEPHHAVCAECGEVWPCRHDRLDGNVRMLLRAAEDACAHCGKDIGYANFAWFFDGVRRRRYHTAQSHRARGQRCVDALERARMSLPESE